jgi:mRNA interferase HicA
LKRRDLIRHLEANGCELHREGARHSIYHNPAKRLASSVPRHSEIGAAVARAICKQLEISPPPHK